MTKLQNVAVFGAGGMLGTYVIEALRQADFAITIVSRPASKSTFPAGIKVIKAEYTLPALTEALQGQDAVVSVVGTMAKLDQITLVDAAVAAGVKRFIPSNFANAPDMKGLEPLMKIREVNASVERYADGKRDVNPDFSWTSICNGVFIDLALKRFSPIFGFDIPARTAKIYDSGNEAFTASTMPDIARAVAGVLEHSVETANKHVLIRSVQTTQNEILATVEAQTGEKWTVNHVNSAEIIAEGEAMLAAGNGRAYGVLVAAQLFQDGAGRSIVVSRENAANGLVGVEEKDISTIVRDVLAS
ncbi:NAD(P)-binding protein [Mycena sanguinolenta]|uniref:NAD(P)-binding protein n=1 Tax=Mycena sanguinolenta TaxID=230812 RepID=A0A8H6YGJ8_9AGAR|nr:NAD(P)-binding protein [Mycena sanguinolenta]